MQKVEKAVREGGVRRGRTSSVGRTSRENTWADVTTLIFIFGELENSGRVKNVQVCRLDVAKHSTKGMSDEGEDEGGARHGESLCPHPSRDFERIFGVSVATLTRPHSPRTIFQYIPFNLLKE